MPTTVLATKLFAPARRPAVVARPRLVDRMDAALEPGRRLTLVSAPAGFGKTTLVTDWIEHSTHGQRVPRVAWLSLDEGDNDVGRLLAHLVAALQSVEVRLGAVPELVDDPAVTVEETLTALVNELARAPEESQDSEQPQETVLVLDDYHVIEARAVHEAMAFLVDQLPPRLHLVVTSRSDPPFGLSRLRVRDELVELRAADLRFTPEEATSFLNQLMGLGLSDQEVEVLETRTEGWIAGLQLAALSLRGRSDVPTFIGAFAGSDRFVLDYLVDEVLQHQAPHVREFLLHTAVLDRLAGSLCDAVTGRTDGAVMLENLERANLFVVGLDDSREWSRYHHLFADMLRARLLSEDPDLVPVLHRRASDWYQAHELAEDAVRHALAAQDFDRAAYLIEEALPELRRTRQDSLLLAWARTLPESVVRRHPVLSILSAWSLMMAGDLDAMERRLDDAEAAIAAGTQDQALARAWADTEDVRTAPATVSVYRASLAQARGDVAGTVRHARQALDLAGPEDHFVRGAAGGFLGLAAWAAGDAREALSTFGDAVRSLHAAGNLVDELDGTVVLADMWLASGRPSRARRLYERALHRATEGGEPYPRATADLHVGLAELDRELDDLTSAETHLESARLLRERAAITENRHRWFVAQAFVRAAAGDHDSAAHLLDQAEALYRHGFYPDIRPIAAIRARLQIAGGDLKSAAGWADDRGVSIEDDPDYLHEYEHLTLVRLLVAQHRSAPRADAGTIRDVLGMLDRLRESAVRSARLGSLLEIGVLRALAHQAEGNLSLALDVLEQALDESPEPGGYARLLLDEGEPMVALLREAETRGRLGEHPRRLLRAAARTGNAPYPVPSPSGAVVLSDREQQVLRLLDSTLTGPEIARQLFVTLNTLRSHTKHIFTKLDVNSRAAAVRRARERGLL